MNALRACRPVEDARTLEAVLASLAHGDVDVRENASYLLADFGDEAAIGPLRAAAARAPADEERRNHERAQAAIQRRLGL